MVQRALEGLLDQSEIIPDRRTLWQYKALYPPVDDALAIARERAVSFRLFTGHYHVFCRKFPPRKTAALVIFRDPIERNMSMRHHMVAHLGWSEYFFGRATGTWQSNRRRQPLDSVSRWYTIAGQEWAAYRKHLLHDPIADPQRALNEAMTTLDECEFVSTTSEISALQESLSDFVGKPVCIGFDNESSGTRPRFTPQEIAAFKQNNELDMRLFERALKKAPSTRA